MKEAVEAGIEGRNQCFLSETPMLNFNFQIVTILIVVIVVTGLLRRDHEKEAVCRSLLYKPEIYAVLTG